MASGKSYGKDRERQQLCAEIIKELRSQENLTPYSGDGIDISISMCGTIVSLDVALKNPDGGLLVVECRRWKKPIQQEALFAFLAKLECLRNTLKVDVEGVFVTRRGYQLGALKMATKMGIGLAICEQDQSSKEFTVAFKRYLQGKQVLTNAHLHISGELKPSGSLSLIVFRGDGSVEDLGEVPSQA
jgi:hypothetical protein